MMLNYFLYRGTEYELESEFLPVALKSPKRNSHSLKMLLTHEIKTSVIPQCEDKIRKYKGRKFANFELI